VFPVRYETEMCVIFKRNSAFRALKGIPAARLLTATDSLNVGTRNIRLRTFAFLLA
jgi:hypothetical protein